MNTEQISVPLRLKVLHFLRFLSSVIARFFFALYYGKVGEKVPAIADEILRLPAIEVAKKIRNKEISSVEVLEACIRRIKDVNSILNCFVEDRFELALKEAREADELIRSGTKSAEELRREKVFLGVPFTTKDCIFVKDLHNTAGVVLRKDVIASEDADAIKLLRAQGAIIIGLTNVPELCMWWESHNHIYGRTKNPYNTTRIPGGSSGGEGCLQAVGGSIFGIGSDIGGSIRMPAFFNGIFGHKPSRYIVSNNGLCPSPQTEMQESFLGIGPMTRHAIDLKPILRIISGENKDKLNLDQAVELGNLKIFYQFRNGSILADDVDPEIIEAMKNVLEFFNKKYKLSATEKTIPLIAESNSIWFATMKSKERFGQVVMGKDSISTICVEMVKNLFGCSNNTLVGILTAINDRGGVEIGSERHNHYVKLRDNLEKTFKDMLGDNGVFLYPTHPTTAPYHNETIFKALNFGYTAIINCLGLPATTVPLGLSREGLPIGIQVIANHNNDRLCLAVAEELEKAFGGWIEPQNY